MSSFSTEKKQGKWTKLETRANAATLDANKYSHLPPAHVQTAQMLSFLTQADYVQIHVSHQYRLDNV